MKTRSSAFLDYYRWPGFYENVPDISHRHKLISSLTLTLISLLFTPHALTPTPPSLARFLRSALRSTPW